MPKCLVVVFAEVVAIRLDRRLPERQIERACFKFRCHSVGRGLATKGTKSTKERLSFVLFVPIVANPPSSAQSEL
jgi:hypothetical protein